MCSGCGCYLWRVGHRRAILLLRAVLAAGTRHEGRPVAIDSCVARRPPALKASAEDAAVERLAQLLLSVPDVSRSLLQQLLANLKCSRGQCSRLTMDGAAEGGTDALGSQGGVQGAAAGGTLAFSDADITRFQAGLRKCLTGVLQIKVGRLQLVCILLCCARRMGAV